MKELQVIYNQEVLGQDFKIYGTEENPLFLAKDVANWIEHSNPSKMVKDADLDDAEVARHQLSTLTNSYTALFLTEDGLYEVLMQSRKPIAKQFKKNLSNGKYNLTIKKKNNFNGTRAKVLPCAYIAAQSAYLQSNAIISIYQKRKCNL